LQSLLLKIDVTEILIHKAHQPDIVVNFFDADGLAGKDLTEIDFFATQANSTATSDDDGFIVGG